MEEYEKGWLPVPMSGLDIIIYPEEIQVKQRIYYYYLLDTWYTNVTGWKESWYKFTSLFRVIGYLIYKIIDYFWSIPYYYKKSKDLAELRKETKKTGDVELVDVKTEADRLRKGRKIAIDVDAKEEKENISTELKSIKKEVKSSPGKKRLVFGSSKYNPSLTLPSSTEVFKTPQKI